MAGFCSMNGAVGFANPSYTHALLTAGPLYMLFFQVPHSTLFICLITYSFSSVQFSSVAQLCLTLCDPMNRNMPGFPVHHQLLEFTQTHIH